MNEWLCGRCQHANIRADFVCGNCGYGSNVKSPCTDCKTVTGANYTQDGRRCDKCHIKYQDTLWSAERERWRELAYAILPVFNTMHSPTSVIAEMQALALEALAKRESSALTVAQVRKEFDAIVNDHSGRAGSRVAELHEKVIRSIAETDHAPATIRALAKAALGEE